MLAWRSLRAQLHHLVLGRICVVLVHANNRCAGFGAVPVHCAGPCRGAAPGGDVPERPGLSSADSSTPRGQFGPSEVEPTVHGILPPRSAPRCSTAHPSFMSSHAPGSVLREMEDVPSTAIDTELRLLQFG